MKIEKKKIVANRRDRDLYEQSLLDGREINKKN